MNLLAASGNLRRNWDSPPQATRIFVVHVAWSITNYHHQLAEGLTYIHSVLKCLCDHIEYEFTSMVGCLARTFKKKQGL